MKLIKTKVNYILEDDKAVIIASTSLKKEGLCLSLKNCEAIENGYDINELATKNAVKDLINDGYDGLINPHTKMLIDVSYMNGFQKALEILGDKILGDKKFSEKQMYEFADYSWKYSPRTHPEYDENLIKQKTEWDVIIVMEYIGECNGNNDDGCFQESPGHNCGCFERKPKLDKDGCLILKRK